MKLKEKERVFDLRVNIQGFGREENTILKGLKEKLVIETGSFLSKKIKIEISKISDDSVTLKIINFCFERTTSKNGKLVDKITDNKEELAKEEKIKEIQLLRDYKDYEVEMKLNEEISIISFISPSYDIKIKIAKIYEKPIMLYE